MSPSASPHWPTSRPVISSSSTPSRQLTTRRLSRLVYCGSPAACPPLVTRPAYGPGVVNAAPYERELGALPPRRRPGRGATGGAATIVRTGSRPEVNRCRRPAETAVPWRMLSGRVGSRLRRVLPELIRGAHLVSLRPLPRELRPHTWRRGTVAPWTAANCQARVVRCRSPLGTPAARTSRRCCTTVLCLSSWTSCRDSPRRGGLRGRRPLMWHRHRTASQS